MNNETVSLKPHKTAFFFPKILPSIFLCILIIVISLFFDFLPVIAGAVGVSLLFLIITFWIISIQYRKTSYILTTDKIIYNTGSLFYDKQTELPIKNITHLKSQLPFISYWLFKTGNINVESAGSDATEGKLTALDNSNEIYQKIQDLMKKNGFSLKMSEIQEDMKPSPLAVILDTFKFILTSIVLIAYVFIGILSDEEIGGVDDSFVVIMGTIAAVIFLGVLIFAIFRYIDLSKRLYRVYNDTITYKEGFLTKNDSLIPFENLTDSTATQSVIDRLFELYDVSISCQGAGKEIRFKNIINGKEVSQSIRNLLQKFKSVQKPIAQDVKKHTKRLHDSADFDTKSTGVYRMNKTRAFFFPTIGLLLSILGVFIPEAIVLALILVSTSINTIIAYFATTYSVKEESMHYYFKFLNTKEKEFVNSKITSVVFTESLIDKMFDTCQIDFGSIGSATKMRFKHIKKQSGLYTMFLNKVGIKEAKIEHQLLPNFGFFALMKSNLILPIILLALIAVPTVALIVEPKLILPIAVGLGVFLAIFLPIYIYSIFYYKKAGIYFFKNYLHVKKGIIIETNAYATYHNIKDIETVKYPLTGIGNIYFNIAGENVVNLEKDASKATKYIVLGHHASKVRKTSHSLALSFIENIPLQNDLLDHILQSPMDKEEISKLAEDLTKNPLKPILTEKPDIGNTLLFPSILAIFLILLIVLTPIPKMAIIGVVITWLLTAGLIAWVIKAISFEIQSFRIVKKSGIFYKKQISILFVNIDHINKSQGFTNKIFSNGNIAVHTIGSSKLEMNVQNLKHYLEFYEKMKAEI